MDPNPDTPFNLNLKRHAISVTSEPSSSAGAPSSTPLEEFTARKMRYTVSLNGNFQTRETTCGKFSSEIAAFVKEQRGTLVGIDGINGYKCGPTDQEILQFAHPIESYDPKTDPPDPPAPKGWFDTLGF